MSVSKRNIMVMCLIFGLGIGVGNFFSKEEHDHEKDPIANKKQADAEIWTCAMHPQIQQSKAGKCPLCGMELIPIQKESVESEHQVRMSSTAMALANVQTSLPRRTKPFKDIRLSGKMAIDQRSIRRQSSHIAGRIEHLNVNFVGASVEKGQTIASIYAPELVTAQKELLSAYKNRETNPQLFAATKAKLRNWKISERQIERILQNEKIIEVLPITADVSGTVLYKKVNLGDYVEKGQSLFEVGDLSQLWLLFDVYEADLTWIKLGDTVHVQVSSQAGDEIEGVISFIDPVINPRTRVAKARVEIDNPMQKYKPEQFVIGVVEAMLSDEEVLVVPKSSVMWTGARSIVYVKQKTKEGFFFMLREVKLGANLGDEYCIQEGLSEDDEIATNGTFSIDSAAQLLGKPSMMNQRKHVDSDKIDMSKSAKSELRPLLENYLKLKTALVSDDLGKATEHLLALEKILKNIDSSILTRDVRVIWEDTALLFQADLKMMKEGTEISILREHFVGFSTHFIALIQKTGSLDEPLYIEYCPMADNLLGASWISVEPEIRNPYFGASMLGCGEVKEEIH
jgi:membrane fusion protein, copper/silver efflux system